MAVRVAGRRTGQRLGLLAVGVTLLMLLAACGGDAEPVAGESPTGETDGGGADGADDQGEAEPVVGGTLRIGTGGMGADPVLDPPMTRSGGDPQYMYALYDRLVTQNLETLEFEPGLATKWEFLSDPERLVMTLQEGVTFHDGTSLDAEAVKFNVERSMTHPDSTVSAELGSIEEIVVNGPHEIEFRLSRRDVALLGLFANKAGFIASPTALEAQGDDFRHSPVGSGPYTFVEYQPSALLRMERNPDYWDEDAGIYLDALEWVFHATPDAAINALLAGNVDIIPNVPPKDAERLQDAEGLRVQVGPSIRVGQIYLNLAMDPVSERPFRQALNYAIDRELAVDVLNFGLGGPAYQPLPPGHWAHTPEVDEMYPYDPERARQLVEEAGLADEVLTLVIIGDPESIRRAEFVKEQYALAGITTDITVVPDFAQLSQVYLSDAQYGAFMSFGTGRPDASQQYFTLFHPEAFLNVGHIDVPEVTELIAESGSTADQQDRDRVFDELNRAVMEAGMFVPVVNEPLVTPMQEYVRGFQQWIFGIDRPTYRGVWLEQ